MIIKVPMLTSALADEEGEEPMDESNNAEPESFGPSVQPSGHQSKAASEDEGERSDSGGEQERMLSWFFVCFNSNLINDELWCRILFRIFQTHIVIVISLYFCLILNLKKYIFEKIA